VSASCSSCSLTGSHFQYRRISIALVVALRQTVIFVHTDGVELFARGSMGRPHSSPVTINHRDSITFNPAAAGEGNRRNATTAGYLSGRAVP
jgi:hypothetical protein